MISAGPTENSPFLDQFDLNFSFTPCVKSPKGPGTRGLDFCWVLWRSGIGRLRQVQSPLWYRQYKCQCTLSTTHVHNGTFVTHSSYGLHAATAYPPLFLRHESQDAQTARPPLFMLSLLCSRSPPGFVIGPALLPSLSDISNRASRKA